MPRRPNGIGLTNNEELTLLEKAMSGDMVISITPTTLVSDPVSVAWTRNVLIEVKSAAGELHSWLNGAFTTILSIGNTSTAGTASIVSTTMTLVNGQVTTVVTGTAHDWLNTETDTLTVANTVILGYTVTGGTSVETFTTP
jgi:hypothetical protein